MSRRCGRIQRERAGRQAAAQPGTTARPYGLGLRTPASALPCLADPVLTGAFPAGPV